MREIIFRGLRTDGKGWVYGSFVKEMYNSYIVELVDQTRHAFSYISVIPETVGQYTGMKDRNGRKIFEGDIIDSWAGVPDNDEMYIRTVVFDDNYGIMKLNPGTGYTLCRDNSEKLFEVIGNIHDTNFKL